MVGLCRATCWTDQGEAVRHTQLCAAQVLATSQPGRQQLKNAAATQIQKEEAPKDEDPSS